MLLLKLSKIPKAGVGVFTTKNIKKDTLIPLFAESEEEVLIKTKKPDFLMKRFCLYHKKMKGYLCPPDFNRMSIGYYLNNSQKPNVEAGSFKALRSIKAGEELTINYDRYF